MIQHEITVRFTKTGDWILLNTFYDTSVYSFNGQGDWSLFNVVSKIVLNLKGFISYFNSLNNFNVWFI